MGCFFSGLVFFVALIIAMSLLGMRDRKRNLKQENSRSIEERIREIRENASTDQIKLPKLRNDIMKKFPEKKDVWSWIEPVIVFNRRLEQLASSNNATAQEARELAVEAKQFLIQNKIKGIFIAESADKLAKLIQERDSKS